VSNKVFNPCRKKATVSVLSMVIAVKSLIMLTFTSLSTAADILPTKAFTNIRLASDFSTRVILTEDDEKSVSVFGIDLHNIFSNTQKDLATLVFQPYVVHFSQKSSAPYYFDGDRSELTWRIANLNFHLDTKRRFNLKLGHFEIPFGLEYEVDSNGTLKQYSFSDRGLKADWGTSLNGTISRWNYEIALTRGSGNDYTDSDNTYVMSGRIGQEWDRPFALGFSIFEGRVQTQGEPLESTYLGIDTSYRWKQYQMLTEISFGEKSEHNHRSALLEARWSSRDETLMFYLQKQKTWTQDDSNGITARKTLFGVTYQISRLFDLSTEWNKRSSDSALFIQVRVRI